MTSTNGPGQPNQALAKDRQNTLLGLSEIWGPLLTEQGYRITQAARSLDIGANLLGRWKHQFEAQAIGIRLSADEREELKRLHKEVRQLRMEKEILKKASQYFAKEMK